MARCGRFRNLLVFAPCEGALCHHFWELTKILAKIWIKEPLLLETIVWDEISIEETA